ncbi:MAG: hypothetical protein WC346_09255 [Methanogenium sp.]|jgi:hypothetical protein
MTRKPKEPLNETQKKSVWTFFTLLFPSLIMALLISFERTTITTIVAILLFFYQAILLKNFIERYYIMNV